MDEKFKNEIAEILILHRISMEAIANCIDCERDFGHIVALMAIVKEKIGKLQYSSH